MPQQKSTHKTSSNRDPTICILYNVVRTARTPQHQHIHYVQKDIINKKKSRSNHMCIEGQARPSKKPNSYGKM